MRLGRYTRRVYCEGVELEITAQQAKEWMAQGAHLIDVREDVEWIAGHAPDAVHIPMGLLSLQNLPQEGKIIVICRSGNRSMHATMAMREAGLEAYNFAGGMYSWQSSGGAVIAAGGEPGVVI